MTPELDMEDAIVGYLKTQIPTAEVEALGSTDMKNDNEIEARAERNSNGYIVVYHTEGDPDESIANYSNVVVNEKFIINIFSKNRRDRDGIYELVNTVRQKLTVFTYSNQKFLYKGHRISPMPLDNGVHLAEVYFELNTFDVFNS